MSNPTLDLSGKSTPFARLLLPLIVMIGILFGPIVWDLSTGTAERFQSRFELKKGNWLDGAGPKETEKVYNLSSTSIQAVRPIYAEQIFRLTGQANPHVVIGRDHWLFQSSSCLGYPRPRWKQLLMGTCDHVSRICKWFEERGTKVIVVPVPVQWSIYPSKLPDLSPAPQSIQPTIVKELARIGVPLVDVRPAFLNSKELVYWPNDSHWNHRGSFQATQQIATKIRSLTTVELRGRRTPPCQLTRIPHRHTGDLQRLFGFRKASALSDSFRVDSERFYQLDKPILANGKHAILYTIAASRRTSTRVTPFSKGEVLNSLTRIRRVPAAWGT